MMISTTALALILATLLPSNSLAAVPNAQCPAVPITSSAPFSKVLTIVLSNADQQDVLSDFYLGHYLPLRGYLLKNMSSTTTGLGSYVDLLAGDSLGLTASSPITATVNAPTILDLLDKKNLPWKAYLESYLPAASPPNPTTCSPLISSTSPQGYTYSKSHNPFLVFKNITSDPTRCNLITNEQSFAFDVANNSMPTWGFYVSSLENSGFGSTVVDASFWLQSFLEPLLVNPEFAQTLFIITFDNSRTGTPSIYTLLIGSGIPSFNGTDTTPYTHTSLVSTVEKALGLGSLAYNDTTIPLISGSQYQCLNQLFQLKFNNSASATGVNPQPTSRAFLPIIGLFSIFCFLLVV